MVISEPVCYMYFISSFSLLHTLGFRIYSQSKSNELHLAPVPLQCSLVCVLNNFLKTHVVKAKYLLEVINKKQEHYVSEGLIILGKGPVIKTQ